MWTTKLRELTDANDISVSFMQFLNMPMLSSSQTYNGHIELGEPREERPWDSRKRMEGRRSISQHGYGDRSYVDR